MKIVKHITLKQTNDNVLIKRRISIKVAQAFCNYPLKDSLICTQGPWSQKIDLSKKAMLGNSLYKKSIDVTNSLKHGRTSSYQVSKSNTKSVSYNFSLGPRRFSDRKVFLSENKSSGAIFGSKLVPLCFSYAQQSAFVYKNSNNSFKGSLFDVKTKAVNLSSLSESALNEPENTLKDTFWNICFDKGRLKNFVSWFLKNYGEHKTVQLLDQLKSVGFEYATKSGLSLGIDDLKIPPRKALLMLEAEKQTKITINQYNRGEITGIERFQRLIDAWHRTSELLKQEVINHFEATDILNPVYMMAFSGARGNISQVRQLVGMRGLMADPQGQILDFPIRSNFREGLTLTEYIISCYGARKGIVDTALRTANAGYLTRRLVDVAQHVIISHYDCGTKKGIFLKDMKEGNKTLYSLQNRLVGRVLAKDITLANSVAARNQEISADLAFEISKVCQKVFVRSPLTCETKKLVCQLCYGWSLAQGNLVSIGEAVGIVAAQSIGEPGTQLTMRTFHTGGVFSGDVTDQIRAPYSGFVRYAGLIPGTLIRTLEGQIAFLTKGEGVIFVLKKDQPNQQIAFSEDEVPHEVLHQAKKFKIPAYTVLFVRNGENVIEKQVIAQISSISRQKNIRDDAELTIKTEIEGQFYAQYLEIQEKLIGPKSKTENSIEDFTDSLYKRSNSRQGTSNQIKMDKIKEAWDWGYAWILSGKTYQLPIPSSFFPKSGDLVNKNSMMNQIQWFISDVGSPACSLNLDWKVLGGVRPSSLRAQSNQKENFNIEKNVLSISAQKFKYDKIGYFFNVASIVSVNCQGEVQHFCAKHNFQQNNSKSKDQAFNKTIDFKAKSKLISEDSIFVPFSLTPRNPIYSSKGVFRSKGLNGFRASSSVKTNNSAGQSPTNATTWNPLLNRFLEWFPKTTQMSTGGLLVLESSLFKSRFFKIPKNSVICKPNFPKRVQQKNRLQSTFLQSKNEPLQKIGLTRHGLSRLGSNESERQMKSMKELPTNFVCSTLTTRSIELKRNFVDLISKTPSATKFQSFKTSKFPFSTSVKDKKSTQSALKNQKALMTKLSPFNDFSVFSKIRSFEFQLDATDKASNQLKSSKNLITKLARRGLVPQKNKPNSQGLLEKTRSSKRSLQNVKNSFITMQWKNPLIYQLNPNTTSLKKVGPSLANQLKTKKSTLEFYNFSKTRVFWVDQQLYKLKSSYSTSSSTFYTNNNFLLCLNRQQIPNPKPLSLSGFIKVFNKKDYYTETRLSQKSKALDPQRTGVGQLRSPQTNKKLIVINLQHYKSIKLYFQSKFNANQELQHNSMSSTLVNTSNQPLCFANLHTNKLIFLKRVKKSKIKILFCKKQFIFSLIRTFCFNSSLKILRTEFLKTFSSLLQLNYSKPKSLEALNFNLVSKEFPTIQKNRRTVAAPVLSLQKDLFNKHEDSVNDGVPQKLSVDLLRKFCDKSNLRLNSLNPNLGHKHFAPKSVTKPFKNRSVTLLEQYPSILGFNSVSTAKTTIRAVPKNEKIFSSHSISNAQLAKSIVSSTDLTNAKYLLKFKSTVSTVKKLMRRLYINLIQQALRVPNPPITSNSNDNSVCWVQVKNGWVYQLNTDSSFKTVFRDDKVFFFPGQPVFDHLIFDRDLVYVESISIEQKQEVIPLDSEFQKNKNNLLWVKNPKSRFWPNFQNFPSIPNFGPKKPKKSNRVQDAFNTKGLSHDQNKELFKVKQKSSLTFLIRKVTDYTLPSSAEYKKLIAHLTAKSLEGNVSGKLNVKQKKKSIMLYNKSWDSTFVRKKFQSSLFNKQNKTSNTIAKFPNIDFNVQTNLSFVSLFSTLRSSLKTRLLSNLKNQNVSVPLPTKQISTAKNTNSKNQGRSPTLVKKTKSSLFAKQIANQRNYITSASYFNKKRLKPFNGFKLDTLICQKPVNLSSFVVDLKVPYNIDSAFNTPLISFNYKSNSSLASMQSLESKSKLAWLNSHETLLKVISKEYKQDKHPSAIKLLPILYNQLSTVFEQPCFNFCLAASFSFLKRSIQPKSYTLKSNKVSSLTKFYPTLNNMCSLSKFLAKTSYFSPFEGEILKSRKNIGRLRSSSSKPNLKAPQPDLKKTGYFYNKDNNTCLILTKKDLISFTTGVNLSKTNIMQKLRKINNSILLSPESKTPGLENQTSGMKLGNFMSNGDIISARNFFKLDSKKAHGVKTSGQIVHVGIDKVTLRFAQPIFISPKAIFHVSEGSYVNAKSSVITLAYQRLKTGDIVQGIPKVEQFFEARPTKGGRLFRDSLPNLLSALYKRYSENKNGKILKNEQAVRQSFYKLQQIVVDGVQRVYLAQGVAISDKHLEIIVKQMTSKVLIVQGGPAGFFPGELIDLDFVEKINLLLTKKIKYEPVILGITRASLEVPSFLSAASFQQSTRILTGAALSKKKDFLRGLKENVMLGNLIPAGTGYLIWDQMH